MLSCGQIELDCQVGDMLKWEEVLYSPLVQLMQARLTLVSAGFPIRALLQERGRLGQLEKMRTLLGRIRSSPRTEVPGHLRALLPEMKVGQGGKLAAIRTAALTFLLCDHFSQDLLEEVEQLPAAFRSLLAGLSQEIAGELDALQLKRTTSAVAANLTATAGKTASIMYLHKHTYIHTLSLPLRTLSEAMALYSVVVCSTATAALEPAPAPLSKSGSRSSVKFGRSSTMQGSQLMGTVPAAIVDPQIVKQWCATLACPIYRTVSLHACVCRTRQLGILLFSCDLPAALQELCLSVAQAVAQQQNCNELVDQATAAISVFPCKQIKRSALPSTAASRCLTCPCPCPCPCVLGGWPETANSSCTTSRRRRRLWRRPRAT